MPSDEQIEAVRALILSVPAGRVTTYGDVADAAGLPTPRMTGWVLRHDGSGLPWQRVVRADGTPAPHKASEQLRLLRAEGVSIRNGRVDLKSVRANLCQ